MRPTSVSSRDEHSLALRSSRPKLSSYFWRPAKTRSALSSVSIRHRAGSSAQTSGVSANRITRVRRRDGRRLSGS